MTTPATLVAELNAATGGETLQLAPGLYPSLPVKASHAYTAPVTLQPADPASPPVFEGSFNLWNYANLTLKGLKFQLPASTTLSYQPLIRFYSGKNIAMIGCELTGLNYLGHGVAVAGTAPAVDGLDLIGNKFRKLHKGVTVSGLRNFRFLENDFVDINVDAFILADCQKGEISRNLFDAFATGTEHPDLIQFHSNGFLASSDIVIEDNFGACDIAHRTQGIFIRGQYATDTTQRHKRFAIRRNIFALTMWHGITPGQTDELVCEDNTVLTMLGTDKITSRIDLSTATGVSNRNKATKITLPAAGIVSTGDLSAQPETTDAAIAGLKAAWLAKFRAPPLPAPSPVVTTRDPFAIVADMEALCGELRAAL